MGEAVHYYMSDWDWSRYRTDYDALKQYKDLINFELSKH